MGNIYLKKEGLIINGTNFGKLINILDPLNNHNNLGKSISYHSKSKMKKIISYMNKQLKYIHEIRKKGNPFIYINSLLNLFKITLSTTYIDLFINYMNSPRLTANSKLLKTLKKNGDKNDKKKLKIEIEDIYKFNNLFMTEKINSNLKNCDEEEYDKYVEENEESSELEDNEDKINLNENSNSDENLEEDEYAVEEEEYLEVKDDNNDIENKNIKMDKDIKFVRLINNKIIKKLFELYDSKEKMINFNNTLLDDAANYWNNLENFLKENKLI